MDLSRREKIVFYGVIPIAAAVVGSVVTVITTRAFGGGDAGDAIRAVITDPQLNAAAKAKMIELINANDRQFYDLIRSVTGSAFILISIGIGYGLFNRK